MSSVDLQRVRVFHNKKNKNLHIEGLMLLIMLVQAIKPVLFKHQF